MAYFSINTYVIGVLVRNVLKGNVLKGNSIEILYLSIIIIKCAPSLSNDMLSNNNFLVNKIIFL